MIVPISEVKVDVAVLVFSRVRKRSQILKIGQKKLGPTILFNKNKNVGKIFFFQCSFQIQGIDKELLKLHYEMSQHKHLFINKAIFQ